MADAPTAAQSRRMTKVAALGCLACIIDGHGRTRPEDTAIHHVLREGRRDHDRILPLCGPHHGPGPRGQSLHPFWKAWEAKYGTQEQLLEIVAWLLGERERPDFGYERRENR